MNDLLVEIGARLLGSFIALLLGLVMLELADPTLGDSKLKIYLSKLCSGCVIIGGLLVCWASW